MQTAKDIRARAWHLVWNNYPEDAIDRLKALEDKVVRLHVGKETAPTTGTPHLQGHVRFKNPIRLSFWPTHFRGIHAKV